MLDGEDTKKVSNPNSFISDTQNLQTEFNIQDKMEQDEKNKQKWNFVVIFQRQNKFRSHFPPRHGRNFN